MSDEEYEYDYDSDADEGPGAGEDDPDIEDEMIEIQNSEDLMRDNPKGAIELFNKVVELVVFVFLLFFYSSLRSFKKTRSDRKKTKTHADSKMIIFCWNDRDIPDAYNRVADN